MTCEIFNTVLHELSTGRPVESRLERDARVHARACEACEAAFDGQRQLTAVLGHVAAADAALEAPDGIEATVLGAFRLAHGTANVVPIRPVTSQPVVASRRFSSRWMAAAAAIVIGVGATLVTWQSVRNGAVGVNAREGTTVVTTPVDKPHVTPPSDIPTQTKPPADRNYGGPAPGQRGADRLIIPVSTHTRVPRPARVTPPPASTEGQELVTEFYSLVPASSFAPTEGGQLVRLEVPRSSLASLGVPMPMGNPDGSVTADLVMGYDGVAHAIRFVQPRMTDERRIR